MKLGIHEALLTNDIIFIQEHIMMELTRQANDIIFIQDQITLELMRQPSWISQIVNCKMLQEVLSKPS